MPVMKTVGDKIDRLAQLRDEKRALEEQVKAKDEEITDLEEKLMAQMDKENITKSTGQHATVSISSSVRPTITDWDAFYAYISKNKFFHLLERRPSAAACRELFETKGSIPGAVPYTQRRLNLRSL